MKNMLSYCVLFTIVVDQFRIRIEIQIYSSYCLVLPAERYPPPREWFHTKAKNYQMYRSLT